jgi:hypothetical protein
VKKKAGSGFYGTVTLGEPLDDDQGRNDVFNTHLSVNHLLVLQGAVMLWRTSYINVCTILEKQHVESQFATYCHTSSHKQTRTSDSMMM